MALLLHLLVQGDSQLLFHLIGMKLSNACHPTSIVSDYCGTFMLSCHTGPCQQQWVIALQHVCAHVTHALIPTRLC
jgi:hypothetical protein